MKRFFSILAMMVFIFSFTQSNAQLREVPQPVRDSFKAQFSNAKNVDWIYSLGKPQVEFRIDGTPYKAQYDKEGNRDYFEYEIMQKELPAEVLDGFKKSKYADWIVKDVYKIQNNDDAIQYRISVKGGSLSSRNLLFNSEGQLQKDNFSL